MKVEWNFQISNLDYDGKIVRGIVPCNAKWFTGRLPRSFSRYSGVMISAMASQIIGVSIIYSIVCSGADERKHQSSASLAFVWGIRRSPVNSPHKGPVTRKIFPFHDFIMVTVNSFVPMASTNHSWNGSPCDIFFVWEPMWHLFCLNRRVSLHMCVSVFIVCGWSYFYMFFIFTNHICFLRIILHIHIPQN